MRKAKQEGKAIGIAHPYPSTLAYLPKELEKLPSNVTLVTVSELLQETNKFRISPALANQSEVKELISASISPQE